MDQLAGSVRASYMDARSLASSFSRLAVAAPASGRPSRLRGTMTCRGSIGQEAVVQLARDRTRHRPARRSADVVIDRLHRSDPSVRACNWWVQKSPSGRCFPASGGVCSKEQ